MADPYAQRIKIAEKLVAVSKGADDPQSTEHAEEIAVLVLANRDEIIKALMRPPAMSGPAMVETIEKVIYHHFYPGPLSGSTSRLANALTDAFPALQGHEG